MRCLVILLVLLPIFSNSQLIQFVREYQPKSKEIKEKERVNLADVETIGFFMGRLDEPATIDLQEWENYLQSNLALDDASVETMPAGNYTVFVQFLIDEEGKIRMFQLTKTRVMVEAKRL